MTKSDSDIFEKIKKNFIKNSIIKNYENMELYFSFYLFNLKKNKIIQEEKYNSIKNFIKNLYSVLFNLAKNKNLMKNMIDSIETNNNHTFFEDEFLNNSQPTTSQKRNNKTRSKKSKKNTRSRSRSNSLKGGRVYPESWSSSSQINQPNDDNNHAFVSTEEAQEAAALTGLMQLVEELGLEEQQDTIIYNDDDLETRFRNYNIIEEENVDILFSSLMQFRNGNFDFANSPMSTYEPIYVSYMNISIRRDTLLDRITTSLTREEKQELRDLTSIDNKITSFFRQINGFTITHTRPNTLHVGHELIEVNIDLEYIRRAIYERNTNNEDVGRNNKYMLIYWFMIIFMFLYLEYLKLGHPRR